MNPNFLLKDELLCELGIRGISSDADVQTLRRLFRSVVSEELAVDVSKVGSLGVEELYASTVSKIVELQNQLTTEVGLAFHATFSNSRLSFEWTAGSFDKLGRVPIKHHNVALPRITRPTRPDRAEH
jgi:hypothetical protein